MYGITNGSHTDFILLAGNAEPAIRRRVTVFVPTEHQGLSLNQLFRFFLHPLDNIRKFLQGRPLPQRLPVVVRRSPENRFPGRDISYGGGVPAKFGSAADGRMILDSRTPTHHDAVPQSYGSGQSGLAGHHTGAAKSAVVGDLNQVVDFSAVTD